MTTIGIIKLETTAVATSMDLRVILTIRNRTPNGIETRDLLPCSRRGKSAMSQTCPFRALGKAAKKRRSKASWYAGQVSNQRSSAA